MINRKTSDLNTTKEVKILWMSKPEEGNYASAKSYLSLLYNIKKAIMYIGKLKRTEITEFKSKDIFRASCLSLLGVSNSHVKKDQEKISAAIKLSPILLVRNSKIGKVVIADGYHRLCAIYSYNEDAIIPCKII